MQSKAPSIFWKILFCIAAVIGLALVRGYESELFYDPFTTYFENDYLNLPFPEFTLWKLLASITFRYCLNMIISLAILYVLFKNVEFIRFSIFLYGIFFLILIITFTVIVTIYDQDQNFILFYIRRFLIQPLFLLLFVPAFLFQQRIAKN